jgi:obg-like ATPase 1
MNGGTDIRFGNWEQPEVDVINTLGMLTTKPQVFLVNMNKDMFVKRKGRLLPVIKKWVDEHCPGEIMIPFSADLEQEVLAPPFRCSLYFSVSLIL